MPLTETGKRILRKIQRPEVKGGYGKKKGKSVFYALINKGTLKRKRVEKTHGKS